MKLGVNACKNIIKELAFDLGEQWISPLEAMQVVPACIAEELWDDYSEADYARLRARVREWLDCGKLEEWGLKIG